MCPDSSEESEREDKRSQMKRSRQDNPVQSKTASNLFDNMKGTELFYPGKSSIKDVLMQTQSISFKRAKEFGEIDPSKWHNKIIFGENLGVLKRLLEMKKEGELKNGDNTPGIRLIYIDPPFGTGDVYGRKQVNSYSARRKGRDYLEWLRQRIVLLRELLSDDGSFYMRLDYHYSHYMKIILDELFGQRNFRNEIIINRTKKIFDGIRRFNSATDSLFFYTKSDDYLFNGVTKPRAKQRWVAMHSPGIRLTEVDEKYLKFYGEHELEEKNGKICSRGRVFDGKVMMPPEGRHWTFTQERLERYRAEGRIRFNPKSGMPEYLTSSEEIVDSNWTDIPGYSFRWNYPTENSEQLLQRIIEASSNRGDLVLDAFAGSGTTGAVAEKLGRRWIMIDSSKASMFTMTKRMLNLKEKIGNTGKSFKPTPFAIYTCGLAEWGEVFDISFHSYRALALSLFHCEDKPHYLNHIPLDGYCRKDHVLVFNWQNENQKRLCGGAIQKIHASIGNLIEERMFIIAPDPTVSILEDVVELGGKEYHILRVPFSLLKELQRGNIFSENCSGTHRAMVKVIDSIAFDLVIPPDVQCQYFIEKSGEGEQAVIKISRFRSNAFSKKTLSDDEVGFKALAMVMIDYDYNGDVFSFDRKWEADELNQVDYSVRFPVENAGNRMMICYSDIFGNEKKEVKKLSDFRKLADGQE